MMFRSLFPLVVLVGLAGCGTLTRLASYGGDAADANFNVDGRSYSASLHPKEDTLLVRPALAEGMALGAVQGVTMGLAGRRGDPAEWLRVGTAFLSPAGCEVDQLTPLDQAAGYWEIRWRCPSGADLRALMAAQRPELRRGQPLRP